MRKNLYKIIVRSLPSCAALCLTALLLCACGANTNEVHDADSVGNNITETQPQAPTETQQQTDQEESVSESASVEYDPSTVHTHSPVTVTTVSEGRKKLTAENGTVYYISDCSYPTVSIEGNNAAAEKINADIISRIDNFHALTDINSQLAESMLEYTLSQGSSHSFMAYSDILSFVTARADENVISFIVMDYEYMDGAHGLQLESGINYSTKTGELIAFEQLSDDPDTFHADTLIYNQASAQTEYYSDQLFSVDDITNGKLESVLYADDRWYLSSSGLVFLSNPYELAPYSSGSLEFTVPYGALNDMGLKEEYSYTGRMIVKVAEDQLYSVDLNGDGNKDTITYYTNSFDVGDIKTDRIIALTHLTVNNIDFAREENENVMPELTSDFQPRLCVYDLDVSDNYVELALIEETYTDTDAGLKVSSQSRLFRYTESGTLLYLGKTDSDVTDPTVTVTSLLYDAFSNNMNSSVTITMETEKQQLTTEDGITYLTLGCQYPVVSIEGNETAAEKINEDIRSHMDSFYTKTDYYELLKSDIGYMREQGRTENNYQNYLIYWPRRADDKVISFALDDNEYMGGMHPNSFVTYINYDTKTGDVITFESLSDDPDAFREATLIYNKELASTDVIGNRLGTTDYISNGRLESVLYAGDVWCLNTYGLSFLSNTYTMASYAEGDIEFTIPYSALSDMGLHEKYFYTDRLIVQFPEIYTTEIDWKDSLDLNGDKTDDSIVILCERLYSEEHQWSYIQTHLIINGTDFAQTGTDDIKEKLSGIVSICLYDLDVNDRYVELAVKYYEFGEYSNILRYTEDGSLLYLGRVKGDITDPTLSFAELEREITNPALSSTEFERETAIP